MVGKVIRDYMEAGNKKLTVPGFGTFMRKDSGEIIFVDLLRKDDGVLRELVEDYGHYSEVEVMALVDRFIFETKNGIEKSGSVPIDGFGTMFLDEKGLYQFDYTPQAKPAVDGRVIQERLFPKEEPAPAVNRPTTQPDVRSQAKPAAEPRKTTPAPRKKGKKSKPDTLIIIAVIAAAIAIAILAFGLSAGNMPFLKN